MKSLISIVSVLVFVGCATVRDERKELAFSRLQSVEKLCQDMTAAYHRGESASNCFVEDRLVHINFKSKADYLLGRKVVSIFIQDWCQMNEQAGRTEAYYSWAFKAEGFSRQERCASLEEKLKQRGPHERQTESSENP